MSDVLEFPDGSSYRVVNAPRDPEHEPLEMEFVIAPGGRAPPPHIHPGGQRETFEVLDGSFELLKGSTWHQVEAGSSLTIEPGDVHTFRNNTARSVRIRNLHVPAHSFERYLRRLHAIVVEHGLGPHGLIRVAMLWREHGDTIRAANPAMGAAMNALALAGRALRIRLPE